MNPNHEYRANKLSLSAAAIIAIFLLAVFIKPVDSRTSRESLDLSSETGGSGGSVRVAAASTSDSERRAVTTTRRQQNGPRPDAPARAATPNSISTWKEYWESELQKTSDPIFQSAMRFQIQSLNQAVEPLNSTLQLPKPLDPNMLVIPNVVVATTDSSFFENYRALLAMLTKMR